MLTRKNILLTLTAISLCVALFFFLAPNREKEVKKQLNRLTQYAAKQQDEPPLTSLTKAAQIGKLFADPCTLTIRNPEIKGEFSRKEVTDRILMARNSFSEMTVSFYDITIQFPVETRAEALLTMRLLGRMQGEDFADVREINMTLHKQDRKWLINGVEFIEVLER